ncbi:MAG: hypothetical protein JW818_11710 [Pirellulales bacterium]|nr:hypothetical protein [Pirellulales bacterium]
MSINGLAWQRGSAVVIWDCDGERIEKAYRGPVTSVCPLRDGDGLALVEPIDETGPNNAVVFNADGTVRFRVKPPLPTQQVQGFADMYYVKDELTAIMVTPGRDFAVVVDDKTGEYLRIYETR